ncbi:retrovirus-related pol polyprotein from transposon TNT 1-94 [Tanacetum coccineum]
MTHSMKETQRRKRQGVDILNKDHLKRNCPKNNHKKSIGYIKKADQPSSNGLIYDGSKVMSAEALLDWIMDSEGLYHMAPKLDIFFDFLECYGVSVLLGDNMECKIRGIGKLRVQLKDGSSFVLHNVRVVLSGTRRDNCVYSLDGHAVEGELNASVGKKYSLEQVWHKRLGHISEARLQVLEKQELFGKKSLELWGPSQMKSFGGKRYFLSIVDDCSRRVCVYILRWKVQRVKAVSRESDWEDTAVFVCFVFLVQSFALVITSPVLLRDVIADYGATPFRLYHSWLSLCGFEQMVTHTWSSIVLDDSNGMVRFKKKLQALKKEIRVWVADQKRMQSGRLNEIKLKLSDIDKHIDQGDVNDEILLSRMDLMKQMHDIKSSDARDFLQKAKIQ